MLQKKLSVVNSFVDKLDIGSVTVLAAGSRVPGQPTPDGLVAADLQDLLVKMLAASNFHLEGKNGKGVLDTTITANEKALAQQNMVTLDKLLEKVSKEIDPEAQGDESGEGEGSEQESVPGESIPEESKQV